MDEVLKNKKTIQQKEEINNGKKQQDINRATNAYPRPGRRLILYIIELIAFMVKS